MNSKLKGNRAEAAVAGLFRESGVEARRRTVGEEASGLLLGRDLDVEGYSVQVKHGERPNVYAAYAEALRSAHEAGRGEIAIAVTKRNRGVWLATVDLATLLMLLRIHRDRFGS